MGTLSDADKNYLAINFRAIFERDYRKAAQAHVDAGWVPAGTRVDQFESALRALCEPVFDRPLKEIYFGKLLIRLFATGRRFGMEVQPQLALLMKTMLQVEGLGRQLDPDLDVRRAAQPILERFMDEQVGIRGFLRRAREEAPFWSRTLPELPRLLRRVLTDDSPRRLERALLRLERAQLLQTRVLAGVVIALAVLVVGLLLR
jgi:ubiquinone biosynthesis protein